MKSTVLVIAGAVVASIPVYTSLTAQSKPAPAPFVTEWPTYGHDSGGQRFSPLTQLTPTNVDRLQVAWVYHMRPAASEAAASSGKTARKGAFLISLTIRVRLDARPASRPEGASQPSRG